MASISGERADTWKVHILNQIQAQGFRLFDTELQALTVESLMIQINGGVVNFEMG